MGTFVYQHKLRQRGKRCHYDLLITYHLLAQTINGHLIHLISKDNDGLPHILEHLIFLGSEDYPYKEALDYLANRCLAKRTNAWTSTDHTCYTVYTAGTSG